MGSSMNTGDCVGSYAPILSLIAGASVENIKVPQGGKAFPTLGREVKKEAIMGPGDHC